MHYKPIDLGKKLFGEDFIAQDYSEDGSTVIFYLKSTKHIDVCPKCGHEVSELHSTYVRKIQLLPIHGKTAYAEVTSYKYYCKNDECEQNVVTETLPFAFPGSRRSIDLDVFILAMSCFLSDHAAEMICRCMGIIVSDSTVANIRNSIVIKDEPDVEEIGVDDVATRKGQKYATAIYDLLDHHLIALLDGRDKDTLKEWLIDHRKIKRVARDRASAYAKAIEEVIPECEQIADKFHLLQNLIDRLKDIFKDELPAKIFIRDDKILDNEPKKSMKIKKLANKEKDILKSLDYDNSVPLDAYGNEVTYIDTNSDLNSSDYKKHQENRIKKQKLYMEIRNEWIERSKIKKQKYSEFARKYKMTSPTIKKIINMSDEEIESISQKRAYKRHRKTWIDDYGNMIYKMLCDGITPIIIFRYVKEKGFSGTDDALRNCIDHFAKNNFQIICSRGDFFETDYDDDIIVISRSDILKAITAEDDKVRQTLKSVKYMDIIKERYPLVEEMENLYRMFHNALMGKNTDAMDEFTNSYENYGKTDNGEVKEGKDDEVKFKEDTYSSVRSFVSGIKKDIAPVKAAISTGISSGFVEGNNCKFKLCKRILYGRSGLVNLFRKCYFTFACVDIKDFSFRDYFIESKRIQNPALAVLGF